MTIYTETRTDPGILAIAGGGAGIGGGGAACATGVGCLGGGPAIAASWTLAAAGVASVGVSGASLIHHAQTDSSMQVMNRESGDSSSAGSNSLTPKQQEKAINSLQKQIDEHTAKLDAYRANPEAFDNLGVLERAPTPDVRENIINSRIRHLETEIRGFQNQIDILRGGK